MEFATTYWGKRPLLSRADQLPRTFGDLLSLDDVDELLSRRGLRTPFIRVAKNGTVVDAARYTGSGGVGAQVADQVVDGQVLKLFADGHTVVLQGLHRLWPSLIDFAGALTRDLGHPVQVNAYVTPKSSAGFAAHYDVHDVFVLQVAGEKRWRVHEPVHPNPLRDQTWEHHRTAVRARATETPLIDTVLHPGDALYLPRGYLHAAEAADRTSLHLTVGVHPVTRYDIVEALTGLAADDAALRESLPLGFDAAEPGTLTEDVVATVEAVGKLLKTARPDDVARRVAAGVVSRTRAAPLAPIAQTLALESLTADTLLSGRPHLRYAMVEDDGQVEVTLPDRRLVVPLEAKPAFTALLSGSVLRAGELPALDHDDSLVLARRLLREGVVVPVELAAGDT